MRLLTHNIRYATDDHSRVDVNRIIDAVGGADVIALQEVARRLPLGEYIDQARAIAEGLGGYYWVFGAGVDLHDDEAPAHSGARRRFGNMVLSRAPILYSRNHLLPQVASTDALSIQRSALETCIAFGARVLRVYSVHLTHLCAQTRLPQVRALLDIHDRAAWQGAPVSGDLQAMEWRSVQPMLTFGDDAVLLGDFNFQPESAEYELIVGAKSDYGGRVANPCRFVDAWCIANGEVAGGYTSDVHDQPARLDYCFVGNALRDAVRGCAVGDDAHGSDHFPLWCEMALGDEVVK